MSDDEKALAYRRRYGRWPWELNEYGCTCAPEKLCGVCYEAKMRGE